MAEDVWFPRSLPMFSQLGEECESSVVSNGATRELSAGALLRPSKRSRREVYVVVSGSLEVVGCLPGGRRVIVNVLEAGDCWGWLDHRDTRDPGDEELNLRAAPAATLLAFSREYFEGMLAQWPGVAVEVARMLGLRARRYEVRLASLLYQTSRQKLASLLLELTNSNPKEPISLSHAQLGALVGISREQVTRILGEFACSGHIQSMRRRVAVLDRAGLQRERKKV
ncbi:MAG: Crp/Fnr family transcriptional regulator [Candidatus Sumerlaeia bacterium]|nr:Crp/Fnr family transcriptional regulator [Candidatus Sumerlaeia bacterium]